MSDVIFYGTDAAAAILTYNARFQAALDGAPKPSAAYQALITQDTIVPQIFNALGQPLFQDEQTYLIGAKNIRMYPWLVDGQEGRQTNERWLDAFKLKAKWYQTSDKLNLFQLQYGTDRWRAFLDIPSDHARVVAEHPQKQANDAIVRALDGTGLAWTGQPFFSTSQDFFPARSELGSFANAFDDAYSAANVLTRLQYIQALIAPGTASQAVANQDTLFSDSATYTFIAGQKLAWQATLDFKVQERLASGADNTYRYVGQRLNVVELPLLNSRPKLWMIAVNDKGLTPGVGFTAVQLLQQSTAGTLENPLTKEQFNNGGEQLFGVARCAAVELINPAYLFASTDDAAELAALQ